VLANSGGGAAWPIVWAAGDSLTMTEKVTREMEAIVARIDGARTDARYQKDQIIFLQGDSADTLFYVQAGRVKVTMVSADGKEAVVAILPSGSFCGEECLSGRAYRVATVRGLTECVLIRMAKGNAMRALQDDPEFSQLFTSYLMERAIRAQEDLADQLLNSTEKRLARLLLRLANFGGAADAVVPKINQETLAEMIGTSRTNVNFFMNKFRQQGFIAYNGDIKVNQSLLTVLQQGKLPASRN
jgi:CRP/FNR family transcriptional regulator, cyclic AMP receptor protein